MLENTKTANTRTTKKSRYGDDFYMLGLCFAKGTLSDKFKKYYEDAVQLEASTFDDSMSKVIISHPDMIVRRGP